MNKVPKKKGYVPNMYTGRSKMMYGGKKSKAMARGGKKTKAMARGGKR